MAKAKHIPLGCVLLAALAMFDTVPPRPAAAQTGLVALITGGAVVGNILKNVEERLETIISQAAGAANLAADAAGRNLKLTVDALRLALNDDLDRRVEQLDERKIEALRMVASLTDTVEQWSGRIESMQDVLTLDVQSTLSRIWPLASEPYAIRRVKGASQFFKVSGVYRVELTSNIFDGTGRPFSIMLDQKPVPEAWVASTGEPYKVALSIPVSEINGRFKDHEASMLPLQVMADVPNQDRNFFEFWKERNIVASFAVPVRLFPRYPAEYRFEQVTRSSAIDRSRVVWQSSRTATIPGCGDSGCYQNHNVFADLPPGAEATGLVRECTDTFQGWGSFVKLGDPIPHWPFNGRRPLIPTCETNPPSTTPVQAYAVAGSTVTMVYRQHSHIQARNVAFKAGYHPTVAQSKTEQIELKAVIPDGPVSVNPEALRAILSYAAASARLRDPEGVRMPVRNNVSSGAQKPSSVKIGYLAYGQTYEARLSPQAITWTLSLRTWGGDPIVVADSRSDPRVQINESHVGDYWRVLLTLQMPQ